MPPSVLGDVSFCSATSPTGASLSASLGVVVGLDDLTGVSLLVFFSRIPTICFYANNTGQTIKQTWLRFVNKTECRHNYKNKEVYIPFSFLVPPGM